MSNSFSEAASEVKSGNFVTAGDLYTQAGYGALESDAISSGADQQVASGLDALLRAGLCYRRGGVSSRSENRCEQGILITTDLQNHVISEDRRRAVLQEYVADFHVIGGIKTAEEQYRAALSALEAADLEYTTSFHSVPIADRIAGFTRHLIDESGADPPEDLEIVYDFAGRVRYKLSRMDPMLADLTP